MVWSSLTRWWMATGSVTSFLLKNLFTVWLKTRLVCKRRIPILGGRSRAVSVKEFGLRPTWTSLSTALQSNFSRTCRVRLDYGREERTHVSVLMWGAPQSNWKSRTSRCRVHGKRYSPNRRPWGSRMLCPPAWRPPEMQIDPAKSFLWFARRCEQPYDDHGCPAVVEDITWDGRIPGATKTIRSDR